VFDKKLLLCELRIRKPTFHVKKISEILDLGTFLTLLLSKNTKTTFKEERTMRTIAIVSGIIAVIVGCLAGAGAADARVGAVGEAVEVRIVTDDGRALPTYPVKLHPGLRKVYAEAVKGDHYRIEVINRLDRRVGLVIAVDGRNIISGAKSWLKSDERMYILEPYGSGSYAGWRTDRDRINRFYFTDVPDSYASAFGDESAMGVIAVALYPEVRRCEPSALQSEAPFAAMQRRAGKADGAADRAQAAPAAPSVAGELMKSKAARSEKAIESAGTGYGRGEYSPSRVVTFEPERLALETIYLKYEWRSTLCRLGVVDCAQPPRGLSNRLWDNAGYAPPPPFRGRP
jgi:hypothetical protein